MSWKDLHVLGVDALGLVNVARRIQPPPPKPAAPAAASRVAAPTPPPAASRVVAPPPVHEAAFQVSTPVSRTIESAVTTAAAVEAAIRAAVPKQAAVDRGAVPTKKSTPVAKKATAAVSDAAKKAAQSSLNSASARAIAAGKKLSKYHPGAGQKLVSLGQKAAQKATTIKGDLTQEELTNIQSGTSPEILAAYGQYVQIMNALSTAADIAVTLSPIITQMQTAGLTDVANAGQAIYQRCADVIDNDPDAVDPNTISTVVGIQSDATAWTSQSQTAVQSVASSAFDPGAAGGGGGGGTDDSTAASSPFDEGEATDMEPSEESDATARFRESGGEDDPLADEDPTMEEGQTLDDEGMTTDDEGTDAADSLDEDEGSTSSEAIQRFRASAGTDDALEGDARSEHPEWFEYTGEGYTGAPPPGFYEHHGVKSVSPTDAVNPNVSPAVAARLAASKKRLADIQRKLAAFHTSSILGLTSGDYHFEAEDLFLPHQALIRTYQEAEAKKYSGEGYTGAPPTTMAPRNDQPSPAAAAKLAKAQKRLADAQRKLDALHAAQLRNAAAGGTPSQVAISQAQARAALEDDGGQTVMGEFDEADDLFYGGHQHQITDDEPDFQRAHGSVHRGAAYLQSITYPPYGASGGQEGGSVDPNEKIEVFGAGYHRGLDALGASPALNAAASQAASSRAVGTSVAKKLGATPAGVKAAGAAASKVAPRASFVLKSTPAGNKHVALVLASTKTHKSSIANAKDVGKRAVSIGNKLLKALSKPNALKKPTTKVHGLVKRLVGKKPHQHFTHAQMKKIAENAVKSGRSLIARADKHQQLVKKDQARVAAGVQSVKGQTHIRGDVDIFGALARRAPTLQDLTAQVQNDEAMASSEYSLLEQQIADLRREVGLDPKYGATHGSSAARVNPRSLIHGDDVDIFGDETDVNIFGVACALLGMEVNDLAADVIFGVDADGDGYDDATGEPLDDGSGTYTDDGTTSSGTGAGLVADPAAGPPEYGIGPPPTVAPPFVDFVPGPDPYHDAQTYDSTGAKGTPPPLGYIVYDGSRRFGFMDLGSLNVFTPGAASSDPEGGGNSGFQIHKDGWWFNWGGDNKRPNGDETPESGGMPAASVKHGWGPLVGNPGVVVPGAEQNTPQSWTNGLRYDVGTGAWFWPYNQAPPWAKAPEDQKRLAKAVLDYNAKVTAAATDAAAQAAADQLEAEQAAALEKQHLAEDANTARQQDQELQAAQQQAAVQAVADQQAQDTQSSYDMSQQQLQAAQDMSYVEQQSAADAHAAELAAKMEAAADEREFELARRLDEAQQGGGDGGDDGGGDEGDYGTTDDGDQSEQGPEGGGSYNMDEDVMGAIQAVEQLHGSARIHARRDARRGD